MVHTENWFLISELNLTQLQRTSSLECPESHLGGQQVWGSLGENWALGKQEFSTHRLGLLPDWPTCLDLPGTCQENWLNPRKMRQLVTLPVFYVFFPALETMGCWRWRIPFRPICSKGIRVLHGTSISFLEQPHPSSIINMHVPTTRRIPRLSPLATSTRTRKFPCSEGVARYCNNQTRAPLGLKAH